MVEVIKGHIDDPLHATSICNCLVASIMRVVAQVIEEGDELVLKLSMWEKIGGFHGDLRALKSSLVRTYVVEKPWTLKTLFGVRAPGTGIPFVIMLGTLRKARTKNFAAIYGRGPVTIYEFKGQPFANWIVSNR